MDTVKIETLAGEVARDLSLSLFDVEIAREGPRTILRVYIEREGGVPLSDIATFSRRFGAILEVDDPMDGPYVLEVSSPGVDRVLKKTKDFEKFLGHRVKIRILEPLESRRVFAGYLKAVDGGEILLACGPSTVRLRLDGIEEARLDPDIHL